MDVAAVAGAVCRFERAGLDRLRRVKAGEPS